MSLATKFRPVGWDQVVGQAVSVTTLRNVVRDGLAGKRVQPSHVLHGPRGVGKTTTARLLAAALNCERQNGEVCLNCQSCLALADGSSFALVEMDAASHGLVDDVRKIQEDVALMTAARWRVYVLDECQSMSPKAWEASLKLLEEPPAGVLFVFCTTEVQKVPATVLSRSFVLPFGLVAIETIALRLGEIARQEGLEVEQVVLEEVARQSGGSVRDAVSLLEQVVVMGPSVESVAWLTGTAPFSTVREVLQAVVAANTTAVFNLVERVGRTMPDLSVLVGQAVAACQDGVRVKLGMLTVGLSADQRGDLERMFERLDLDRLVDMQADLAALYERVKYTRLSQTSILSVGLAKLSKQTRQADKAVSPPTTVRQNHTTLRVDELASLMGGTVL